MALFGIGKPNISTLKNKKDMKGLIKALGFDKDYHDGFAVRRAAAEALGEIGDPIAVNPLIIMIRGLNLSIDMREPAFKALERIGAPSVEPLIHELKNPDYERRWIRRSAAESLGNIGDARAVEPLISALKDPIPEVSGVAAKALGKIGDVRAIDHLVHIYKEDYPYCRKLVQSKYNRESAAKSLNMMGWKPESDIDGAWFWIFVDKSPSEETIKNFVSIGAPAIEPLIAVIEGSDEIIWSYTQRYAAAKALGEIGDARSVEPLISALEDEEYRVRENAAEALGKIGDARAVEPLISALEDEEYRVRENAAEALGEIGDVRAIEPLIQKAEHYDQCGSNWNPTIRSIPFVAAIGQIGGPIAGDILIRWIGGLLSTGRYNPNTYVMQMAAAQALAETGDPRAVEILIDWLRYDHTFNANAYKITAAQALGKIGDARAIEPLVIALKHPSSEVRISATNALEQIRNKNSQK